jgi:hypothetical protein
MAELKLKAVTRTQGNNAALKDGSVRPKTFTFDFVEVDPLIAAFRRMVLLRRSPRFSRHGLRHRVQERTARPHQA